jgi:hypothetical protein
MLTLQTLCGEESLFTFDVGRSQLESLFTVLMEGSHSSRVMWRSHSSWSGVIFTFGEESLFTFGVERIRSHVERSYTLHI